MPTPRTYLPNRQLPPTPIRAKQAPQTPPQLWTDGKLLHDLDEASRILTEHLGAGFSIESLRRRIKNGEWTEGVHWFKNSRFYKLNIHAIVDWQLRG